MLGVLQKMIKQRQESVELYKKGGRDDLVRQEEEEIAIIPAYLPKQMSEADMAAAIDAAVAETGAAGMKDMGKVIGELAREIRRADGHGQGERDGEGEARGLIELFRHDRNKSGHDVQLAQESGVGAHRCMPYDEHDTNVRSPRRHCG